MLKQLGVNELFLCILYVCVSPSSQLFKKDFIYLFLERGEGEGKEGEKQQCVVASCVPPTGGLACN